MTTVHAGAAMPAPACDRIADRPPVSPAIRGRFLARAIAVSAAALGLAHVWVLLAFPHGPVPTTLLLAMVGLCMKCAHGVWSRPRALLELLVMSALMSVTHMFMALGFGGHQHGGTESALGASNAAIAMLAVAAAELLLVMLCGVGARRAADR